MNELFALCGAFMWSMMLLIWMCVAATSNVSDIGCAVFLKAKAQRSKPQGLSASLGQTEAHLMKCASGTFFWCFLNKHKAHLCTL